jgi:exopolysaccharide biosynthesis polyprenyl glycosylphosphotransferase
MIARQQEIRLQVNQLIDALLLGLTFWFCYWLRHSNLLVLDSLKDIPTFDYFLWILAVIMPFGPFLLEMQGYYAHPLEKTIWKSLEQMMRAGLWLGLILGGAVIFLRLSVPSRSVLILFVLLAPVVLLAKERVHAWHRLMRLKEGESGEPVILAGEQERMREVVRNLSVAQRLEIRIAERVDLEILDIEEMVDAIHRHSVGRVILAFSRLQMDKVQRAIEACEVEGVEAWLNADFIRTSVARPTYENLGGRPMLVFRATPEVSWAILVKSAVDRLGALFGLLVLSPLLLALALAVRLSSPGPAIFVQRRAGLHGKPFAMLKFRSMTADAEQRHAELMAKNEMSGPVFKVEDDPRITSIGRWMRRTSLDELPQLVNVLLGDMSLVGPRPLPIYEVEKFQQASHRRRLSMKPGLTCLWQVRGRNNVKSFEDWVRMDLEYIDNWSLWLDLQILFRTIPAVVFARGAK